jgi:hypothetical protein
VSIKLVVSGSSKESRIALVGRTGKELLASTTFTDPRAKGGTLRALKKILGADVTIEDSTATNSRPAKPLTAAKTIAATEAAVAAPPGAKETAATTRHPRRQATASVEARSATDKTPKRNAKSG